MTHPVLGYSVLLAAGLAAAWGLRVAWHAITHPAPCGCGRCSQRRDRREVAALAYQKRRGEQHIRRGARAAARTERRQGGGPRADRLITDLKEQRRREQQAWETAVASYARDSALEPRPKNQAGGQL